MDGVFSNNYWSVEEFFLNLKNYLRTTFNLNDSYCPYMYNRSNDFRCKSKKIASVRLVISHARRITFEQYDNVHFDEKDGETISKIRKLNLSVSFLSY